MSNELTIVESLTGGDLQTVRLSDRAAERVAEESVRFASLGANAKDQAERAVINTEETFGLAGDLVKSINANLKTIETTRKSITSPLDALKKQITGLFEIGDNALSEAKKILQTKQNVWLQAEDKRKREEARAAAQAAEEQALKLAQAQAALGDSKGADVVIEDAAKAVAKIEQSAKVSVQGSYGTTSSGTRVVTGSVTNATELLEKVLSAPDALLWAGLRIEDLVEFKQSGLNKLAKAIADRNLHIPGLSINDRLEARSR